MNLKKLTLSALAALVLSTGSAVPAVVTADIENIRFPFDGPFGKWDQNQLQRGLQVYTEVCSACHGLKYVPLRTLTDLGYSEEQVRAYAADNFEVFDGELDDFRAAIPTDSFPGSNLENAPDLSLMAKARVGFSGPYGLGLNQFFKGMGGPEYIVALLNGYSGKEKEEAGAVLYDNAVFGYIAMGPPLSDGLVEFSDGSPNDVKSMSEDVAAFLMWTAEPKLTVRKRVGFMGVFFLGILAILLYLTNKRLWAPHKGKKTA